MISTQEKRVKKLLLRDNATGIGKAIQVGSRASKDLPKHTLTVDLAYRPAFDTATPWRRLLPLLATLPPLLPLQGLIM
jgi:hypothetical protein